MSLRDVNFMMEKRASVRNASLLSSSMKASVSTQTVRPILLMGSAVVAKLLSSSRKEDAFLMTRVSMDVHRKDTHVLSAREAMSWKTDSAGLGSAEPGRKIETAKTASTITRWTRQVSSV